jgi:hypothetical protein
MGLRQRIEREIRAALQAAASQGGSRVNVSGRVNKVIVGNVGDGGTARASAEQAAPVVQDGEDQPD